MLSQMLVLVLLLPLAVSSGSTSSLNLTIVHNVNVTYQNCSITGTVLNVTSGSDGSSIGQLFRFLDVPYAEPPVDDRRFGPPTPFNFSRQGHIDAREAPATCPHALTEFNSSSISEDCLRLSLRSSNLTGKLPVLALLTAPEDVVVNNGAGDALAANGATVVVTVAYRAGALGFLVEGNPGLADQHLALGFVRDAITLFGGDPTRVTLAGHGADAAAAVGMHVVGAVTGKVGLAFQRAVMMSGSIASPLAWSQSPTEAAELRQSLAAQAGCDLGSEELLLTCLRNRTLREVLTAEAGLIAEGIRFAPVFQPTGVNDSTSSPMSSWSSGAFNGSLLIGAEANVGTAALRHIKWEQLDRYGFTKTIGREFRYFPRLHSVTPATGHHYLDLSLTDWPHAGYGLAVQSQLTRAVGDFHTVCPVWQAAADLPRRDGAGGVFVYLLDAADPTENCSMTDAQYLLGEPLLRIGNCSEAHRNLSRVMMDHLAAFVAEGAPNGDWPKSSVGGFEFMKFGVAKDATDTEASPAFGGFGFGPGRCPLWSAEMLLANRLQNSSTTSPPPPLLSPMSPIAEDGATAYNEPIDRKDTTLANFTIKVIGFGLVTGVTIRTEANVVMTQFLGIPYAKPPVGSLRFSPPERLNTSTASIHLALSLPPQCMQQQSPPVPPMSEDCLYLNLWTPMHSADSSSALPVLVFLHGGFFRAGGVADSRWLGSGVLDHQRVVVVTVGYRLGAFGFLALPDSNATNNGLRDQELALEWVGTYVEKFGGSKKLVTLMGVEAGAASVGYLLGRAKRLFYRAIMLTGSPFLSYALPAKDLRELHANFTGAAYLNCTADPLLSCLRALNASDINAKQADFLRDLQHDNLGGGWWPLAGVFSPAVDGDFIDTDPLAVPPPGLATVPLLLGGVDAPGNGLVTERQLAAAGSRHLSNLTHEDVLSLLDQSLRYFPRYPNELTPTGREAARLRFTRFLRRNNSDSATEAALLARALGSRHFTCPNWRFLAEAADFAGAPTVFGFVFAEDRRVDAGLPGASLFEDAYYALGNPASISQPDGAASANLSRALIQLITTFAESGKPDLSWIPYNKTTRRIRLLTSVTADVHEYVTDDDFLGLECAFWNRTLPCVDSPDCINTPPPPINSTTTDSTTTPEGPETEITPPTRTPPDPTSSTDALSSPMTPESTVSSEVPSSMTPSDATGSSEAPPLTTTTSPDGGGGGLTTLVLALIIAFSIIGVVLLAVATFLVYKFWWMKRDYQRRGRVSELSMGDHQLHQGDHQKHSREGAPRKTEEYAPYADQSSGGASGKTDSHHRPATPSVKSASEAVSGVDNNDFQSDRRFEATPM